MDNNKGVVKAATNNSLSNAPNTITIQSINDLKASLRPNKLRYFEKLKNIDWKKPLPSEYMKIAKALKVVTTKKKQSICQLIDPNKNMVTHNMYNLCLRTKVHHEDIEYLLKKFNIVEDNKKILDEFTARVLIAELLWGRQILRSNSKEVEAIRYYEESLRESFIEVRDSLKNPNDLDKLKLPIYVRINTLAISIEACLNAFQKEGWRLLPRANSYSEYLKALSMIGENEFMRDYHISELLAFPHGTEFYHHPGFVKGKFSYQDKGSCLSSFLLNPKPDSVVLDLCAAPGLKTNHLANIMDNTGKIYAVDRHPDRFDCMTAFLNLTEVRNVVAVNEDFHDIKIPKEEVRYILVDYTSTYSGIFYQMDVDKKSLKSRLHSLTQSQADALKYSLQNFPNVKRVIYTVCSLYPEEGELVVDEVMRTVGDSFYLLNVKEMLWNEWESVSLPDFQCKDSCLRIIPEVDLCQGYFIAVFERNFDVPVPVYVPKPKPAPSVDEVKIITPEKSKVEPQKPPQNPPQKPSQNPPQKPSQKPSQSQIPTVLDTRTNDDKSRKMMIMQNRILKATNKKMEFLAKKRKHNPDPTKWVPITKSLRESMSKSNDNSNTASQGLLPSPKQGLLPHPSPALVAYPNQSKMVARPIQEVYTTVQSSERQNALSNQYSQSEQRSNVFSSALQTDISKNIFSMGERQGPSYSQTKLEPTRYEPTNVFSQSTQNVFSRMQPASQNQGQNLFAPTNQHQNLFSSYAERQNTFASLNEHQNIFLPTNERPKTFYSTNERPNIFSSTNDRPNLFSQSQLNQNQMVYSNDRQNVFSSSQQQQQSSQKQNANQRSQFSRNSTSYPNVFNSERIYEKTHNQLWP